MIIIKRMADIERLTAAGAISGELKEHLIRKVKRLHQMEPDVPLETFSLENSGLLCILESCDQSLKEAGLPEDLALIMPEWVSVLRFGRSGQTTYILYVMSTNDEIVQVYLPEDIMPHAIHLWIEAQPQEEEADGDEEDDDAGDGPF